MGTGNRWIRLYSLALGAFGPQGWWPARTPFEVIVGAILAQHTAWRNAERGLLRLKAAKALTRRGMASLPPGRLARLIRPAGTYRAKARTLRAFLAALRRDFRGSLTRLLREPAETLRPWLLAIPGVGPETADCILLYAAGSPTFVADAYARRILARHGLVPFHASYEAVRREALAHLPPGALLQGEFHALLVTVGKHHCRTHPRCAACPLAPDLPTGTPLMPSVSGRHPVPFAPPLRRASTGADPWRT
jgi:endonuclease-3 related protein